MPAHFVHDCQESSDRTMPRICWAKWYASLTLTVSGRWRLSRTSPPSRDAVRGLKLGRGTGCVLDGSRLIELDTSAAFPLIEHSALSPRTQNRKTRQLDGAVDLSCNHLFLVIGW
jgi:hypothetical protein